MTIQTLSKILAKHHWDLLKKNKKNGIMIYDFGSTSNRITIADRGNKLTLESWFLNSLNPTVAILSKLGVVIPFHLINASDNKTANYNAINSLLNSIHHQINTILTGYPNGLSYPDRQRIKQARNIVKKTLKCRKWHHSYNERHKYVVVASIDNFSDNYNSDDKIFNLVKSVPDGYGLHKYSTQKYSYSQLRHNKDIGFKFSFQAHNQKAKLDKSGTKAVVVTLQHLLDKYSYLDN